MACADQTFTARAADVDVTVRRAVAADRGDPDFLPEF